MDKLNYYKNRYPDAVEYSAKSQAFVPEHQARIMAYGKDVPAKCLFSREIPTTDGVRQTYIFSQMTLRESATL